MSSDPGYVQKLPPSPSRKKVKKGGGGPGKEYEADFYPGFVRKITVRRADGEETVFDQQADGPYPFVLPAGSNKPFTSSTVHFSGGPHGRSFSLSIDDPGDHILSIQVTLKTKPEKPTSLAGQALDAQGGVVGMQGDDTEVVTFENITVCCPPTCSPTGGSPG